MNEKTNTKHQHDCIKCEIVHICPLYLEVRKFIESAQDKAGLEPSDLPETLEILKGYTKSEQAKDDDVIAQIVTVSAINLLESLIANPPESMSGNQESLTKPEKPVFNDN